MELRKSILGERPGLLLSDPGLAVLDGEVRAPLLDVDFTQGRIYCHRSVSKAAFSPSRASSALNYAVQPAILQGTNELRFMQNSAIDRLNGLLIEGADTNVITNNTIYAAANWTIFSATASLAVSDNTDVDLYDGHSFKCVESVGILPGFLYQTKLLTAVKYIVECLVYTNGAAVTSSDMQLHADTGGGLTLLTTTFEHLGNGVYLAWAVFTATAANWTIGIGVQPNKTVYVSLLTSMIAAPTNEGGDFPRSPIPNTTGASITRAADVLSIAADGNIGLIQGTVDIQFSAPCSQANAAANLKSFISVKSTEYIAVGYDATNDVLWSRHKTAGGTQNADGPLAGLVRGDTVKLRFVYGDSGSKKLILYGNRGAGWSELANNTNALGGDLPSGMTLYIGGSNTGVEHIAAPMQTIRFYNHAIVGIPGW